MIKNKGRKVRIGPVAQKILLILSTGIALGLSGRPDYYFRVLKLASKEWDKINQKSLRRSVKKLYSSNLVDYKENKDDTVTILLNENGKRKLLEFSLDKIVIKKQKRWDGHWRIVVFDIPENKKQARDALSFKLKQLGFYKLQKSVYVHPYDCKSEIDFIADFFEVRPYIRFLTANYLDVVSDLKREFRLI